MVKIFVIIIITTIIIIFTLGWGKGEEGGKENFCFRKRFLETQSIIIFTILVTIIIIAIIIHFILGWDKAEEEKKKYKLFTSF